MKIEHFQFSCYAELCFLSSSVSVSRYKECFEIFFFLNSKFYIFFLKLSRKNQRNNMVKPIQPLHRVFYLIFIFFCIFVTLIFKKILELVP